ncbi:MAG: DUF1887 family CARF protein [Bacteroidia bacterium]|nr:DUF1887 family CARF protein [Bacteroidia bacterium]
MTPILLISDQTLPNLLFLKQFGPFERYVFITTDKMEKSGQGRWTAQTAGIPEASILRRVVDPEQPGSTVQALDSLGLDAAEPVQAYITGGTKMMSLGAHIWASRRPAAQILYLPIGGKQFLRIFPDAAEIPLTAQVSLEEYLAVHGVQVLRKGNWRAAYAEASAIFRHLSGEQPDPDIRDRLLWARKQGAVAPEDKEMKAFYAGPWLEVWLAGRIQEVLHIPLPNMSYNVSLNKSGPGGAYNQEYDVIFVQHNRLYIGECKHFLGAQPKTIGDIRKELHKLADANNLFGLSARPFFAIIQQDAAAQVQPFIDGNREATWDEMASILRIRKHPMEMAVLRDPEALRTFFQDL